MASAAPFAPTSDTAPSDDSIAAVPTPKIGDPSPDANTSIKLTMDQVKAAGLDSLSPGDNFTVTITGTVKTMDDAGLDATISDASMGEMSTDEDGGDEPTDEEGAKFDKPKSKIEMGPGKMGLGV